MLKKLIHSVGEHKTSVESGILWAFSGGPVTPDHITSKRTNKKTVWCFDGKVLRLGQ